MKTMNNAMLRSVFAIVLGLVLVIWPEATINYLVIIIGVLFIVPGLISLISFFTRSRNEATPSSFPIEGAGSMLFGIWLVAMPSFFVSIMMYVLGALLLLAGIQQIVTLVAARKFASVALWFYLIPILIIVAGVIIISNPFQVAANTFILFGIASLVYGISELVNWYKFKKNISINL